MNYWILQSNPNSFRLTQGSPVLYYQEGDDDWWGISRYFKIIQPGESAYIWQSIDYRSSSGIKPRGIYAQAAIISVPLNHTAQALAMIEKLKKRDAGAWQDCKVEEHQKSKPAILIKYTFSIAMNPLTAEELHNAGLGHIGVLRFPHADIYKLTDIEANQIETLVKSRSVA